MFTLAIVQSALELGFIYGLVAHGTVSELPS